MNPSAPKGGQSDTSGTNMLLFTGRGQSDTSGTNMLVFTERGDAFGQYKREADYRRRQSLFPSGILVIPPRDRSLIEEDIVVVPPSTPTPSEDMTLSTLSSYSSRENTAPNSPVPTAACDNTASE